MDIFLETHATENDSHRNKQYEIHLQQVEFELKIKKLQENPIPDGFTVEFYQTFKESTFHQVF